MTIWWRRRRLLAVFLYFLPLPVLTSVGGGGGGGGVEGAGHVTSGDVLRKDTQQTSAHTTTTADQCQSTMC